MMKYFKSIFYLIWVINILSFIPSAFAKKVLLINDTTNWYHWGCTGTSLAMKSYISGKGYELTALPITETYKWLLAPLTTEGFKNKIIFKKFLEAYPELIQKILSADIVVINGEGTLHGLRTAPINLLYVAFISKFFLEKMFKLLTILFSLRMI